MNRHGDCFINMRNHVVLRIVDLFCERDQLMPDSLSVKLVEEPFVIRGVLRPKFKIVHFPPGRRDVNISLRSAHDQFPFGFYSSAYFDRPDTIIVGKINF